jgi:hypothetical protein
LDTRTLVVVNFLFRPSQGVKGGKVLGSIGTRRR